MDVEGGKVVNISAVGVGNPDEVTPVVPFHMLVLICITMLYTFHFSDYLDVGPNQDLVNVDEKIQRASLKSYYAK